MATTEDCRHIGFTGEGRCIEPAAEGSPYCVDHQSNPTDFREA